MTASTDRPRVIYVMGAGRSGSTTLGIALGNCVDVFYAGELDNWLVRSGLPQVQDAPRARFWSGVRDGLEDPAGASALFGDQAQRAIERSLSLFRIHRWPTRYRLRHRYRTIAEDLYRSVTRTADTRYVADTSHYPLRALELQQIEGIELYLIYLVRDPQGVVASFNRHDVGEYTKSTLHTNVYLWITHLLSSIVFLRHSRARRLLVRHEDFVADPAAVVGQILECCDVADRTLPDFTALDIGLPLQGNRVARGQTLSLKHKADSPTRASLATALAQAPVMAMLARLQPSTR